MHLSIREVIARTGCSRSFVYSRVAAKNFPEPVRLGPRKHFWFASEIDEWLRQYAAARPQTPFQVEAA